MTHVLDAMLRYELRMRSPELLAQFNANLRKDEEDRFRTLAGHGGSVKRRGSAIMVYPGRDIDLAAPAGGRLILPQSTLPIKTTPTISSKPQSKPSQESDFPKLLRESSRIAATWQPTANWKKNHGVLLEWIRRDSRDQVALTASAMAAEELRIPQPAVRAWRGDEPAAEKKWGWVYANNLSEINLTIDQSARDIIRTTAHECRHLWQFNHYPNLTSEQRETDAKSYAMNFSERVFGKIQPAAGGSPSQATRFLFRARTALSDRDEELRNRMRVA